MREPKIVTLARQPVFADAASILNRLYETYDFLLECVVPDLQPAASNGRRIALGTALEPTVRHRLDQAVRKIRDVPACREELAGLVSELRDRREVTLAAEAERAGTRDVLVAVGDHVDLLTRPDLPARAHQDFTALFREHLSAGEGADHLALLTSDQAAVARDAVDLMRDTAPDLCAGLFQHARYLVAVDGPDAFDSASTWEIPGAAFVALRCMRTPERLAEAMVHEFVHLRLYDLQMTRSVFAPDYDTRTAPTIAPEWHRHSTVSHWPVDRALAAAHVYVHLAAWFEERARACPDPELERSALTADLRASSLLDKVAQSADTCLGPAGRDFLSWLAQVHQDRTAPRPATGMPVAS
ncbi:HEXXH motif-containing putative peptide modification protein [Streptomyces sp. NBC_00820]|uniref:aKG-HExxH-type peptide beta-hydroxylase n=1 Tax=Streptomyces sp. NBC_00820 TaxID=2975842 RepID=UPI002ED51965|nr:HEXXH motif-containing putative peptide modification protein [Streptomyces sp. NBC_00820]